MPRTFCVVFLLSFCLPGARIRHWGAEKSYCFIKKTLFYLVSTHNGVLGAFNLSIFVFYCVIGALVFVVFWNARSRFVRTLAPFSLECRSFLRHVYKEVYGNSLFRVATWNSLARKAGKGLGVTFALFRNSLSSWPTPYLEIPAALNVSHRSVRQF